MIKVTSSTSFLADLHRAARRVRSKYAVLPEGKTMAELIGQEAASLLEREAHGLGGLAREVSLYWLNTASLDKCASNDGIPDVQIDRLCALYEFLIGGSGEGLSKEDLEEVAGMIEDESEELPVDILQSFMSVLLDKGVLDV